MRVSGEGQDIATTSFRLESDMHAPVASPKGGGMGDLLGGLLGEGDADEAEGGAGEAEGGTHGAIMLFVRWVNLLIS